jgi:3D-(3,5/4)-trihydroxycyclohexane-1,2-dione acylhydrolase (decyclizing)
MDEFRDAVERVKTIPHTVAIHVETDPLAPVPSSGSWWDVPVSQVSELDSTQAAAKTYEGHKARQRPHLDPAEGADR